jgi:glycosyltransferase involved in cell wall biosynthesis
MRVVHFQRRRVGQAFSVERLFEDVRHALADQISIEVRLNAHASKGILPRVCDMIAAARNAGDVNHVTGDIHYITYLLRRKRTILTVLDCVTLGRLHGWRRSVFWFFWYWLPLRRACHVTAISEYTKEELLRCVRYPSDRVSVIYPSVSEEFSYYDKPLALSRPRILQIGTSANKNLLRVIEALRGLRCQLVVIGEVSAEISKALAREGIEWENHVGLSRPQLVDQYRKADLVMFASTYEGFGLPIVEANAVGRPVITSNVCAMPEVAGDAALIVDPFDVHSIRAGVKRLCADPEYCQQLVRAGLVNVERFRISKAARQYVELYRRIADGAST